jgi:toxin FitB
LPKGKRRNALRAEVHATFQQDLAGQVLEFDSQAARIYVHIAASRRKIGKPISYADAQIVAMVKRKNATLVTRNTSDFESCGIRLLNPWTA